MFKAQQIKWNDSPISKYNYSGGEGLSIKDILVSWCCFDYEKLSTYVLYPVTMQCMQTVLKHSLSYSDSLKCNGEVLFLVFTETRVARQENKSIQHIHPIDCSDMDKEAHVKKACCDLLSVHHLQLV